MTARIAITYHPASGTGAGIGRSAGGKTLIADRPQGKAGGTGLGMNGGELLASALGGCFWNDLHYVAEAAGQALSVDRVEAEIELAGNPPRVVRAFVRAALSGNTDAMLEQLFTDARADSTISNSLAPAFPISFERLAGDKT